MNTFGNVFKVQVFGESHGEGVGVVLDGVPAGLPIAITDFDEALMRRLGINQPLTTPRKETAPPKFLSGIFNGYSTGMPLTIFFPNENVRSSDYEKQRSIPRPGHADFVAHLKYGGYEDFRGGGHFSARLTTGIVAAGVIAQKIVNHHFQNSQIKIAASVVEVAGDSDIEQGLQKAIQQKDSVGGIVKCVIEGLPIGLGEPFWYKIDAALAHAFMSIPAVKGVEFGEGFAAASMTGTEHNDAIINADGKTATNHAGGVVGGISNGEKLVCRLAFKPTSSTPKKQESWNWDKNQMETFSIKGRHDLCVALRAPVIVEAMAAIVVADLMFLHQKI